MIATQPHGTDFPSHTAVSWNRSTSACRTAPTKFVRDLTTQYIRDLALIGDRECFFDAMGKLHAGRIGG